jgi:subtilisin family serine protease
MKNIIYILVLFVLIIGCSGTDGVPIEVRSKDAVLPTKTMPLKKEKNEPFFQEQWTYHYDKAFYDAYKIHKNAHIHIGDYAKKYTGKGVKIAIIDAGFDINHEEFKKNIIETYNSRDKSSNVQSDDLEIGYHGTAVTGIIASNINGKGLKGLAPDVEVIFIKLDLEGFLDDEDFLDAFELAQKAGADIINCSWGTGDVSEVVKMKIDELATKGREGKGIVMLFASGNDGQEMKNDESAIDSIIGVGSTDEANLRSIYSNFGEKIDILAPGGYELGITTTYPDNRYIKAESAEPFLGTSASTPIVSSLVCLLLEVNPNLTRSQIQSIISLGADKIGNVPYINGRNIYYGNGKVNFSESLKLAETLKSKKRR